jgi:hypothetical protein
MDTIDCIDKPTVKYCEFETINKFNIDGNGYVFVHVNIRSIRKHWDEFLTTVSLIDSKHITAVITLTEVNINCDEIDLYNIVGYNKYFSLRTNRRGGGIVMFVKDSLCFSLIDHNYSSFECLQGMLHVNNVKIYVIGIYRPPNLRPGDFISEINEALSVNTQGTVLILGDINIDYKGKSSLVSEYKDTMCSMGFINTIKGYTREEVVGEHLSKSSIDHILYRGNTKSVTGFIVKSKLADHYITGISIDLEQNNKNIKYFNSRKEYKTKLDEDKLHSLLLEGDTENIIAEREPSKQLLLIYGYFNSLYIKATKVSTKQNARFKKVWMSKTLYNMIATRDKLFRIYKNSPSNILNKKNTPNIGISQIKRLGKPNPHTTISSLTSLRIIPKKYGRK